MKKKVHRKKLHFNFGPLAEFYDPKLTLKQNYRKLGLLPSLNGETGGMDVPLAKKRKMDAWLVQEEEEEQARDAEEQRLKEMLENGLIRFRKDDKEYILKDGEYVECEPLEENQIHIDVSTVKIGKHLGSSVPVAAPVDEDQETARFIQLLKEKASTCSKVKRICSTQEIMVLTSLLEKHGTDYAAMARDTRRNKYQLSEGQIRRKIVKLQETV